MERSRIEIYTDGSCHTQLLVGAWAALVFINDKKTTLNGVETDTTHNRMELLGVINALKYLEGKVNRQDVIYLYSDSQYVVNLQTRRSKLEAKNFITNKGTPIQNLDLVQTLLNLMNTNNIKFVKVKAHQKPDGTQNYNREVDLIVRKLVRENVTLKI